MSETTEGPKMDDVAPTPPRPSRPRNRAAEAKRLADKSGPGKERTATVPQARPKVTVDPSKPPRNERQNRPMRATHEHVAREALGVPMETETHYRVVAPRSDPQAIARKVRQGYRRVDLASIDENLAEDNSIVVIEIEKAVKDRAYLEGVKTIRSYTNDEEYGDGRDPDIESRGSKLSKRGETLDSLLDRMPERDEDEDADEDDQDDEDND